MNPVANCISTEPSPAAVLDPKRCQFLFADGRRCRMPRWEAHPALCMTHAQAERSLQCHPDPGPDAFGRGRGCGLYLQPAEEKYEGSAVRCGRLSPLNIAEELTPPSGEFYTSTDLNRALGKLFLLLAENRIPRRNAVALGYIAQLMLQTLPRVKEEIIAGLGYQAWTDTIAAAFSDEEEDAEDETDDQEADETESDPSAQDENSEHEASREGSLGAPISRLAICEAPGELNEAESTATAPTQTEASPGTPISGLADDDVPTEWQNSQNETPTEEPPASDEIGAQFPAESKIRSFWDQPDALEKFYSMYPHMRQPQGASLAK